ncbi:MAG: Lipoprotein-releasing system transrane protein LolE [Verrucomicrobiota bacterium]|jgi:lipoprotein-releasing system permease protein|nr:FtsX-like permease family protein [Opitutaceae bacterium]HRJ45873.1 FtsX-like permease family protein [Opitutaceae bacterium]
MSPNLHIAFRFLTAKKRAMLMSLSCIVLGVGLFVVTQATTSGFEQFFIRTILGTNGAIRIEDKIQYTIRSMSADGYGSDYEIRTKEGQKYIEGIEEPKLVIDAVKRFPNVAGVSEVLHGAVIMRSAFKNESVRVYGINVEDHLKVSDLERQIVRGVIDDFRGTPSGSLIGLEMARRLQLEVGESYQLEIGGQLRRYRVSAIYETGVSDIDRVRVYLNMGEARSLLRKPTGASFIQVGLIEKDRAVADAAHMTEVLHHLSKSWQEREKTWLEVFRALRISSAITVSVFTLIAGLAMFNTLAMIVMEKTKEIAILRSMGYTREDISRIFIWQATIVLTIGTVLGWILGAGITYAVSKTPISIRGIFAADTFIVAWSIWHYVAATLTAVVMVMLASLVPSRRAARLEPGDVIRGTAQ